jgi:peptidoglycan/LPS O-acetylase OafA/YrhL
MMLRDPPRNQIIDLLRGLSLLMVMGSHFGLLDALVRPAGKIFRGRPVDDILSGMGFYGVAVFFVISGFLITSLSLRRFPVLPQISWPQFWGMRFSRLMPMLALCVLVMILFNSLRLEGFVFKSNPDLWHALFNLFTFRYNELFATGVSPAPWSPLWSLSVEEMFYLGFPLICWALSGPKAMSWLFIALIGASICLKAGRFVGIHSTLGNMDLLATGCLLALARPQRLRHLGSPFLRLILGFGSVAIGLSLIVLCVLWAHPLVPDWWAPSICGAGAALILAASQLLILPRTVGSMLFPISVLGIVSYEAYLIHQPLRQYLALLDVDNVWLGVGAVVVAALALHIYFSEPLNQLLRRQLGGGTGKPTALRWLPRVAIPVAIVIGAAFFARPARLRPIVLHFKSIRNLPAGTVEPLAYIGQPGNGKLVFLQHESAGMLTLGIDDWNQAAQRSSPLPAAALTSADLLIDFSLAGVVVSQGSTPLVRTYAAPRRNAGQPRIGINDIGFSRAMNRAVSTFGVAK